MHVSFPLVVVEINIQQSAKNAQSLSKAGREAGAAVLHCLAEPEAAGGMG